MSNENHEDAPQSGEMVQAELGEVVDALPAEDREVMPARVEPVMRGTTMSLDEAMRFADILSNSQLVPRAFAGNPPNILMAILTGAEMGIAPMQSLRSIHVIEGRPTLSAEMMTAAAKSSPACRYFRLVESTDTVAVYETQRTEDPEPTRMSYTIEQARTAGLVGKGNWKSHPAAMLRARCSASLARAVYPDVLAGIYTVDELTPTESTGTRRAPERSGGNANIMRRLGR